MRRLLLAALLLVGCGDDLPCEPAEGWADFVVWYSPPEDCATACGSYRVTKLPAGDVEPVCVFRGVQP